tara:strand:- start:427 stop:969 length:543 start_codon:yes stop_codon:yes gene_type:complete
VNICIALYKGKGRWHNGVVRDWTNSEYSHAELILPDFTSITIFPFSLKGVRREPFVEKSDKEWDYICVPVNPHQLSIIENFYEKTKGQQYDWVGMLASQLVPFHIKHKDRWYCSEWIAYALRLAGIGEGLYGESVMSPEVLSRLVPHATTYGKFSDVPTGTNWNNTWLEVNHFGPNDADK